VVEDLQDGLGLALGSTLGAALLAELRAKPGGERVGLGPSRSVWDSTSRMYVLAELSTTNSTCSTESARLSMGLISVRSTFSTDTSDGSGTGMPRMREMLRVNNAGSC